MGRVCCWFFSYFERILDWNSNFVSINTIFHIDLLNEFLEATWSLLSTKLQIYFINDVFFLPASSPFYDLWERVDGTKRAIVCYKA